MSSKFWLVIACLLVSCATPKPTRVLTISEQMEVDTERAKNFFNEFQKRVTFVSNPAVVQYLDRMARKLAGVEPGLSLDSIQVKIHQDAGNPQLARPFAFPGTTLSIPLSFLEKVDYENELAAMVSFELANVIQRHLSKRMEQTSTPPTLFGDGSVFELDRPERAESIALGIRLEYYAGYDPRGMASVFQRYPEYFANESSELDQKEVEFNVREAQKAKSEYLPSRDPIVRSAEFINMKRGLKRL